MRVDQGLLRKLRSYFLQLPGNLCVRVYRSTALSHDPSGAWQIIDFSHERWDTGSTPPTRQDGTGYPNGFWQSGSPEDTRLVAVKSGFYVISGTVEWEANATGWRGVQIYLSAGAVIIAKEFELVATTGTPDPVAQTVTTIYWLAAGDYVSLLAYQDSGGALDILSVGNYSPEFSMVRVP